MTQPAHYTLSPPQRYRHLVGKECVVPMSGGRTVPIVADEYVDMEVSNAVVMAVCHCNRAVLFCAAPMPRCDVPLCAI